MIEATGVESNAATKLCGKLDTMIARFVLGKSMVDKFDTMEDVARRFVKDLRETTTVDFEDPWRQAAEPQASHVQGDSNITPSMVQYDAMGQAMAPKKLSLQNHGFVAGVTVINKGGNQSKIEQAPASAAQ